MTYCKYSTTDYTKDDNCNKWAVNDVKQVLSECVVIIEVKRYAGAYVNNINSNHNESQQSSYRQKLQKSCSKDDLKLEIIRTNKIKMLASGACCQFHVWDRHVSCFRCGALPATNWYLPLTLMSI
jgi:hypothetical protein